MSISNHLPPVYRDRLVAAAARPDEARRIADIDQITDELARQYPELVLRRGMERPAFASMRFLARLRSL